MSDSIELRAARWAVSGDTGTSSKAIARHMLGLEQSSRLNYPCDGGDLGRCIRLLEAIPEWRARLPEMAQHTKMWSALVEHWDELTAMHARKDAGLYDRMQAILRKPEDATGGMVRLGNGASIRFGG